MNVFADTVPATLHVATLAEQLESIGIGVLDHVMIEDLSVVDARADFAASLSLCLDGMVLNQPIDDVQIVYVLFVDMVATQPGEVIPVPHLVFEFSLFRLAWTDPNAPAIPIGAGKNQIANCAVL